jgi:hypothetical protein
VRPGLTSDHQEVIREIFKRQNMKPTMVPKTKEDQVQWIQLMWRSDENKLSLGDKYNVTTTVIKIKTHLNNEDSVTFKPLRLGPIKRPLDKSQKYERASVEIKRHTNRAFIQDTFQHLTITHGSNNLPPDISMSQLQSATEEENKDDIQENTANDDHDQKSNPTVDEDCAHTRIAVGENHKPKVTTVKRAVQESYMIKGIAENEEHDDQPPVRTLREIMKVNNTEMEGPLNADPAPGTVADQEDLDHEVPGQEPENCHQKDRLPYMCRPNEKTDLGDILDQDQNAQRGVTMADNALLQVRNREAHHVVGDDAVCVVTKYETHLEEEESVDTYMNNADSTHQQDVTKTYGSMTAVSTTDDAQHQLMHGQSIPRAFFMNRA